MTLRDYLMPGKEDNCMETRCTLIMTKNGKKEAEIDITDMPVYEIARTIEVQEILGREWEYKWR